MSSSGNAKGKTKAVDGQSSSNADTNGPVAASSSTIAASTANELDPTLFVLPHPIPSTTLVNIEYPGVIPADEEGGPSSETYSALDRALSTLHPSALPPLTSSPHEALNFLSSINNDGIHVVECRLGSFARTPHHGSIEINGEVEDSVEDFKDIYRTPLSGEAVQTHNLVIRIVKRTWRQKKRKRTSDSATSSALDDSDAKQYTGRVKKEYKVQVLGMATKTVRFRSPADFAFRPETASPTQDGLDPVASLHKALATMDLEALKRFRIPEQLEDYQLPADKDAASASMVSNLRMIPPACFSRLDVPFAYNFQQSPYSELRVVPRPPHMDKLLSPVTEQTFTSNAGQKPLADDQMMRFVNRVRLSNIAPQPFRIGRDANVPVKPLSDVLRIERRCDPKILVRLRDILVQRPIWSRVAFKNQLTASELFELEGTNAKVYFALVGYAMVGGAWRDTVVRFGYDPRTEPSSRVFQRVFLRSAASAVGRAGEFREETAGAEDDDEAEEDGTASPAVVPRRKIPTPIFPSRTGDGAESAQDNPDGRNSHQFDGQTLNRSIGNFQLCDVTDPYLQPFIHGDRAPAATGQVKWLRDTCDPETGWYTRRALDLIRALISARFKALLEPNSAPLPKSDFDAIIDKFRRRWVDEDAAQSDSAA